MLQPKIDLKTYYDIQRILKFKISVPVYYLAVEDNVMLERKEYNYISITVCNRLINLS